jgi:hypothetical protein
VQPCHDSYEAESPGMNSSSLESTKVSVIHPINIVSVDSNVMLANTDPQKKLATRDSCHCLEKINTLLVSKSRHPSLNLQQNAHCRFHHLLVPVEEVAEAARADMYPSQRHKEGRNLNRTAWHIHGIARSTSKTARTSTSAPSRTIRYFRSCAILISKCKC